MADAVSAVAGGGRAARAHGLGRGAPGSAAKDALGEPGVCGADRPGAFGDAAGAVLLEPTKEPVGIQDALLKSDGRGEENLYIKAGGSAYPITVDHVMAREQYVVQFGRPVFKAAVSNMSNVVKTVISRNNLTISDVNWLVPHQANRRIIETVAKMADFPMERVMMNIHKYGNTTAGTIPLCLWDYEDQLKKGDNLILTSFGGGYTWGAIYLKWAY